MATIPDDEPRMPAESTRTERALETATTTIGRVSRPQALLALAAGAAATAPEPLGAIAATLIVVATWDLARRK